MSYIIIGINAVLMALLVVWAASLRKKEKWLEETKAAVMAFLRERQRNTRTVRCVYHLTESDLNKKPVRMARGARERIEGTIGRKVVKEMGLDEIVEGGVLAGYKLEIEVRKLKGES